MHFPIFLKSNVNSIWRGGVVVTGVHMQSNTHRCKKAASGADLWMTGREAPERLLSFTHYTIYKHADRWNVVDQSNR